MHASTTRPPSRHSSAPSSSRAYSPCLTPWGVTGYHVSLPVAPNGRGRREGQPTRTPKAALLRGLLRIGRESMNGDTRWRDWQLLVAPFLLNSSCCAGPDSRACGCVLAPLQVLDSGCLVLSDPLKATRYLSLRQDCLHRHLMPNQQGCGSTVVRSRGVRLSSIER